MLIGGKCGGNFSVKHKRCSLMSESLFVCVVFRRQRSMCSILHSISQPIMVCGSVWVCPLCAAKISEHRRVELEQAIARCIATGGAGYLTTYTIAHTQY